jgi:hypothetical protein
LGARQNRGRVGARRCASGCTFYDGGCAMGARVRDGARCARRVRGRKGARGARVREVRARGARKRAGARRTRSRTHCELRTLAHPMAHPDFLRGVREGARKWVREPRTHGGARPKRVLEGALDFVDSLGAEDSGMAGHLSPPFSLADHLSWDGSWPTILSRGRKGGRPFIAGNRVARAPPTPAGDFSTPVARALGGGRVGWGVAAARTRGRGGPGG